VLTYSQKINYFLNSTIRYFAEVKCPFCSSVKHKLIDRKYIVTRLFECEECRLFYRHPLEKISQNKIFYQEQYKEIDKITASLPTEKTLADMIRNKFNEGNKNADRYVDLFDALCSGKGKLKMIDYGCSWGYMTYQFAKIGFDVQGFEISEKRAEYGKLNLGVDIKTSERDLRQENDLFFSSHVIEHHPDIKAMIQLAKNLLKPDGYFLAISPNGSRGFRLNNLSSFHRSWGKVHPNYLNSDFYAHVFKDNPYYIGSSPFNIQEIRGWKDRQIVDNLDGEELMLIVKPNKVKGDES
jgi:2-polyprenyl-3-methyl-5-hydroxy-6-metoxy-1,4-benzoquinol methylase